MSDPAGWQQHNDDYLAAALFWLRLRLEQAAGRAQSQVSQVVMPAPSASATPASAARPARWFGGRAEAPMPETTATGGIRLLPAPSDTVTDEQVAQAEEHMRAAEAADPAPALLMLGQRLGLTRFEREVLLFCAGMELDTRIARLCALAQDDGARPFPTFALALALFESPSWDVVSPERPLRYWRLIEISQPGGQPLTASALRADERVVNYLKGLNYLDDRLASLLVPRDMPASGTALPPSQQAIADLIAHRLRQSDSDRRLPIVQLLGSDRPSKQLVADQVAAAFGLHVYRLPAELMPQQPADLETLARLWQRESLLLPLALYLDAPLDQVAPNAGPAAIQRFLERGNGLFFFDTRDPQPGLGDTSFSVEVEKPTPAEQRDLWAAALGDRAGDQPARLTSQFNLSAAEIARIAGAALAEMTDQDERALGERLWDGGRLTLRPRVEALAQRLDPKATWNEIVLPDEAIELLRQIGDQVGQRGKVYEEWGFAGQMNRGLGISALFAGDSGTGKTMAAEVIANHLRLDLYRIDLSAVVSKYIGETEKNLRKLFDAVEDGGAILFFDEADALFGKRSEVKDSHDRYANIEINYLLQRMESYRGLAILATNMKSALDSAFLRRLRFVVNFPFPAPEQRRQMWQKAFPSATPRAGLDYDRLARLNLTGGNIHTVAINAAFMAANAGAGVTMEHVLKAARIEFRKLDRAINEADFRWP